MKFLWLPLFLFYMNTPEAAASPPVNLRILTFNAWLLELPFNLGSRDSAARVSAMPEKLAQTAADIIALQEVWAQSHKDILISGLRKHGYRYFYHEDAPSSVFLRGLFGNGLLIVSKLPLALPEVPERRVLMFGAYTRSEEYFAGKGALHVRVQVPGWGDLSLYNTHYGAVSFNEDEGGFDAGHEARRLSQARELFDFIRNSRENRPALLVGDFNSHFRAYRKNGFADTLVTDYAQVTCADPSEACLNMQDSYLNGEFHVSLPSTTDGGSNLYIGTMPFYKKRMPLRFLDYIFVSRSEKIRPRGAKVVLTENVIIPGRAEALPLSDHFGLLSVLELK